MFRIGSNSKVFTTAMMYMLRDAGKVHLDEQVWLWHRLTLAL